MGFPVRHFCFIKFRFFFIAPLLLLHLHCGLALLHNHFEDSWHNAKDPIHQLSTTVAVKLQKFSIAPGLSLTDSIYPDHRTIALYEDADTLFLPHKYYLTSAKYPTGHPLESFPNKASPA